MVGPMIREQGHGPFDHEWSVASALAGVVHLLAETEPVESSRCWLATERARRKNCSGGASGGAPPSQRLRI